MSGAWWGVGCGVWGVGCGEEKGIIVDSGESEFEFSIAPPQSQGARIALSIPSPFGEPQPDWALPPTASPEFTLDYYLKVL